ncbi:MAG: hypothetical protein K5681_03100 [Treponema sp.]|nr:hypothetical protein [Treponema sp.]
MKKIITSILGLLSLTIAANALPGFTSYLADNSGEYVYYKDNTFTRESYVGMLYYDEATIQIRYYAPQDNVGMQPEKDIAILMTINPDASYWEMTGERILSTIMPNTEDTDLVNYLHDILYEFSSHRQHADDIRERDVKIFQDYEQFGGSVAMLYDCTIPLFNIKGIYSIEGQAQLECVTTGQLKDSFDKSFEDFKGFPKREDKKDNKSKANKAKSKAKSVKYKFENQTVSLDSDWSQPMENFWMLGDNSMVTLGKVPSFDKDSNRNECYIIRRLIESAQDSYTDFSSLLIKKNKNKIEISANIFQGNTEKYVISTKVLAKNKENNDFGYFSISTFENAWKENPSYYQKIIKSYSN